MRFWTLAIFGSVLVFTLFCLAMTNHAQNKQLTTLEEQSVALNESLDEIERAVMDRITRDVNAARLVLIERNIARFGHPGTDNTAWMLHYIKEREAELDEIERLKAELHDNAEVMKDGRRRHRACSRVCPGGCTGYTDE